VSSEEEARGWRLETSPLFPLPSSLKSLALPVVGRESGLTQLHNLFAKAACGERQLVFITGEPGIGKTTLVDVFLQQLQATHTAHIRIGRGQCIEHYGTGEAYLPILDALGRLCRTPQETRLIALLAQHAPTWLVQLPALLSSAHVEMLQR